MKTYYTQRASAGLIVTEATAISPQGVGYPNTPGIWSNEQVNAWRSITDSVHNAGGRIVLQLWHVGRISHSSYLNGQLPVAPSAIAPAGHVSLVRPIQPYETPKALSKPEIKAIQADYKKAAQNAKEAGFDGVEIHGANGYLPDLFLESKTNLRNDEYGGTIPNRARFMLEITQDVMEVWGADQVGMHLSPRGKASDIADDTPQETFGYVAQELGKLKLAFLFLRDKQENGWLTPYLKQQFGGPVISNDSIPTTPAEAEQLLNTVDAVAFGRLFISNPDLVARIQHGHPLTEADPATFYAPGEIGYTNYPVYAG